MEERPRPAVVKTFAKGEIRLFPTAGTKMTSPDENDYVLRGGDHGAERLRANDQAQQRRGPSELHVWESLPAPAGCCSAWFGAWLR